jgi:hypothetical protein
MNESINRINQSFRRCLALDAWPGDLIHGLPKNQSSKNLLICAFLGLGEGFGDCYNTYL